MGFLTDRTLATGVTLQDLIHIVITGDTSQNPAGSSYKATIKQVSDAILSGFTGNTQLYELGSGTDSTQRIGVSADAGGNCSLVSGGFCNTASGDYSFVGGGQSNTSLAPWSLIVGGCENYNRGNVSTISGGYKNSILVTGNLSFIGGGCCNEICNQFSVLTGGRQNKVVGTYLTISGGYCNTLSGDTSFIGGGRQNTNFGSCSTIGGGSFNTLYCKNSVITGGLANTISSNYTTISGGYSNRGFGDLSTIAGGSNNKTNCSFTFIGGGFCNTSSGNYSTISGGYCNTTSGIYSTISGGYINTASGDYSSILGGSGNTVSHCFSSAVGCGVTSVSACTFHTNYLALQNTPETDIQTVTQYLTRDSSTGVVKTKIIPGPTVFGLYAQTGNSITVSGTTSELSIVGPGMGTLNVPANGFSVGDSFAVRISGDLGAQIGTDLTLRVKSGSVEFGVVGPINMPNVTSSHFSFEITFTIRALGTAGNAKIQSSGFFTFTQNAGNTFEGDNFSTLNQTTFDTTIPNQLDITAQFDSTNSANFIFTEILVLNKIY